MQNHVFETFCGRSSAILGPISGKTTLITKFELKPKTEMYQRTNFERYSEPQNKRSSKRERQYEAWNCSIRSKLLQNDLWLIYDLLIYVETRSFWLRGYTPDYARLFSNRVFLIS
jgi:hypothetical protein